MNQLAEMVLRGVREFFQIGLSGRFYDIAYIDGGRRMFLTALYRSMVAGGIVLAVLLLRVLLKRAPKVYSYLLWALVLYRLLCPFTFVSPFSFLSMFETGESVQIQAVETDLSQDVQLEDEAEGVHNLQLEKQLPEVSGEERWTRRSRLWVAAHVWIAGIAAMLLYGAVSLVFLIRRLRGAVRLQDNIYLSDYVPTPFVIGVIRPRIYLPSSLQEKEMDYIILHERTHIRRGDHIIRMLSFLTLTVYWFHPLIWAAYYFSGKDMEMSCDEAVMRKMGEGIRKDYATSLLNLATGKLFPGGAPLAFGEGDTKTRIENVMQWRRPKPAVGMIALAAVAVAALTLGTDPQMADASGGGSQQMSGAENEELRQVADAWAKAVCDRDGNTIVNLSTVQTQEMLKEEELLSGETGDYSFGWSSPWPWDSEKDYRIVECGQDQTVIQYYAWTSVPHVTVWQELLTWEREEDGYRVSERSLRYLDAIADSGSFVEAYGAGINGTPMDYLTNGAGEALYENALQGREDYQEYEDLFAPETAAASLLNLSTDGNAVTMDSWQADGSVTVTVFFAADGGNVSVKMIQPYGEDGIWVAQDVK